MSGDRANPGKDVLEVITYDGDVLIDSGVRHEHGMLISKKLRRHFEQVRPMPVYEQPDVMMPPIKMHSILHIAADSVSPQDGDGWELNRVLPAVAHDEESSGGGQLNASWAQSLLFLLGAASIAFTGWQTYQHSLDEPEATVQQVEAELADAGLTPIESELVQNAE